MVDRKGGQIGAGSTYPCYHGDRLFVNTILAWRPFERILTKDLTEMPIGNLYVIAEYRLAPTENGTRLTRSITRATASLLLSSRISFHHLL